MADPLPRSGSSCSAAHRASCASLGRLLATHPLSWPAPHRRAERLARVPSYEPSSAAAAVEHCLAFALLLASSSMPFLGSRQSIARPPFIVLPLSKLFHIVAGFSYSFFNLPSSPLVRKLEARDRRACIISGAEFESENASCSENVWGMLVSRDEMNGAMPAREAGCSIPLRGWLLVGSGSGRGSGSRGRRDAAQAHS